MNEPVITIVDVGKYKFQIIDTPYFYGGKIYSRNFKIGGSKYADCVSVSIDYSAESLPISAKIPHAMYDEYCTLNVPF